MSVKSNEPISAGHFGDSICDDVSSDGSLAEDLALPMRLGGGQPVEPSVFYFKSPPVQQPLF